MTEERRYYTCDGCGKRTQLAGARAFRLPASWQRVASTVKGVSPSIYCGACYRERNGEIRQGREPSAARAPSSAAPGSTAHKGSICEACGYREPSGGLMLVCASCGIEQSGPRLIRLEEELRRAAYKLLREPAATIARTLDLLARAAEEAARHTRGDT